MRMPYAASVDTKEPLSQYQSQGPIIHGQNFMDGIDGPGDWTGPRSKTSIIVFSPTTPGRTSQPTTQLRTPVQ